MSAIQAVGPTQMIPGSWRRARTVADRHTGSHGPPPGRAAAAPGRAGPGPDQRRRAGDSSRVTVTRTRTAAPAARTVTDTERGRPGRACNLKIFD
jgi:hypothetical protein